MKTLCRFIFAFSGIVFFSLSAMATWSIIVIDVKTKQIGMAGASCSQGVYGIGVTVPGKGAIIVQAMSNSDARRKGYQLMLSGATAPQILKAMMDPEFDPEDQQYAVITLTDPDSPVTYTGKQAYTSKGAITGRGISVQGNTLASDGELQAVFDAAVKAQKQNLPLEQVLMLALEAGAKLGGDKRCGERKASSSFLIVHNETDTVREPWLKLVVSGGDAAPDKNAVELLRARFEAWKRNKMLP